MSNYSGYGRFIVHKCGGEFCKYEIVHSEITQFGHTVPYKMQTVQLLLNLNNAETSLENGLEVTQPSDWLSEHIHSGMPYEMEHFIEDNNFKMEDGEYAEICGFLTVEDTSGMTDCGWEYDCCNYLVEPQFTIFKLEDLKKSYYYSARDIAEWSGELGNLQEGETKDSVYERLVKEGYPRVDSNFENMDEVEEDDIGC